MRARRRQPNLVGLVVLGMGLSAVGIATENMGLMWTGVVFMAIGVVNILSRRRAEENSRED